MPTMYDSATPSAIPADAEIVAGYVDGNWPTFNELPTTHPNAKHVSITVYGAPGAMVGDVEVPNFGATTIEECAAHGAAWAKGEIAAGRRPTLYYSRSSASIVGQALANVGVPSHEVDYWVADWTGAAHMIAGAVATQWASPGTGSGGNFDISETVEAWPSVSEPPAPVPTPPAPVPAPSLPTTGSTEGTSMVEYQQGGQQHVIVSQGTRTVHYWQALAGSAPEGAPADFYDWHAEVLPEPA